MRTQLICVDRRLRPHRREAGGGRGRDGTGREGMEGMERTEGTEGTEGTNRLRRRGHLSASADQLRPRGRAVSTGRNADA
jgi:hypothetical protein